MLLRASKHKEYSNAHVLFILYYTSILMLLYSIKLKCMLLAYHVDLDIYIYHVHIHFPPGYAASVPLLNRMPRAHPAVQLRNGTLTRVP